jgi:hypothetical protein
LDDSRRDLQKRKSMLCPKSLKIPSLTRPQRKKLQAPFNNQLLLQREFYSFFKDKIVSNENTSSKKITRQKLPQCL